MNTTVNELCADLGVERHDNDMARPKTAAEYPGMERSRLVDTQHRYVSLVALRRFCSLHIEEPAQTRVSLCVPIHEAEIYTTTSRFPSQGIAQLPDHQGNASCPCERESQTGVCVSRKGETCGRSAVVRSCALLRFSWTYYIPKSLEKNKICYRRN